jgi:hypothetical protein
MWQYEVLLYTAISSCISITFIIFVHWKKGPKIWQKCAPILYFILYGVNYIAIPLTNAGVITEYMYEALHMHKMKNYKTTFFLYFFLIYATRFFEFFTRILPIFKDIYKQMVLRF